MNSSIVQGLADDNQTNDGSGSPTKTRRQLFVGHASNTANSGPTTTTEAIQLFRKSEQKYCTAHIHHANVYLRSNQQRKIPRNLLSSWFNLRTFFYNIFTAIFSALKLKCAKDGRSCAETSTPQASRFQTMSDNSFFLLEDSNIDFEESPDIKDVKSFYTTPDLQIVNSTPLNHYNHGNSRRNRGELSRTSLL